MGRQRCALCRNYKGNRSFFSVPKVEVLRKRWNEKCGIKFTNCASVCEDHFLPSDFINPPGGAAKVRLQPGAVPRFCAQTDVSSSLRPGVSANQTKDHIELINEELFDETIVEPFQVSEGGEDKEEGLMQDIDMHKYECQNSSTESGLYISKGVQTGSSKSRTCGFIEVSMGKPIYNMICFHCGMEFPIWSWTKFVTHIKENHTNLEEAFTNTDDLYNDHQPSIKRQSGLFQIKSQDDLVHKSKTKKLEEKTNQIFEIKSQNDIIHKSKTNTLQDKTNTIKVFKIKRQNDVVHKSKTKELSPTREESLDEEIIETNIPDFKGSNESLSETRAESTTYISCENPLSVSKNFVAQENPLLEENQEIRLGSTPSKVILNFLELLRTFPILCAKKCSPAYDDALKEFTEKFNEKCNLNTTIPEMCNSIRRIKEWYRFTYIGKQNNPDYKHKFVEYYDKCAEFINFAELRENKFKALCDICQRRSRNEITLQAHKFYHHNIGELPFKCSHCDVRLATSDRLEMHERTHTRARSFICEICKRGFFNEFQLKVHMRIHNEDSKKMCHICGKKFRTLSRYRTHKVIHETPKFKCNVCSKAYHRNCYLVEHMKAHQNQRDHICDQCGKTFVRRKNLMEHTKVVHDAMKTTGTKPYSCQICGQEFRFYSYLYHHRKNKHSVLESTANELAVDTTSVRTKYKYVKDPVTQAKRVVCEICGNTYSAISGIIAHKTKVHGFVRLKDQILKSATGEDDVDKVSTKVDDEEGVDNMPTEMDVGKVSIEKDSQESVVEDDQYEDENTEWNTLMFDDIIYTDLN